jgi:hypothetical protein
LTFNHSWASAFGTGSGIGIFVKSGTGKTGCRTARHFGILKTLYKGEKVNMSTSTLQAMD